MYLGRKQKRSQTHHVERKECDDGMTQSGQVMSREKSASMPTTPPTAPEHASLDRKARIRARARAILRTAAMVMRGVQEMQNKVEAKQAELRKLTEIRPQDASSRERFAHQRKHLLRELVQAKRRHMKASATISPKKTRRQTEGRAKLETEVNTKAKTRVTFQQDACSDVITKQGLHKSKASAASGAMHEPKHVASEAPNPSTVVVESVTAALRKACTEQVGDALERRVEAELWRGAASLSALLATGELAKDCAALEEEAALHVVCQGVLRGIMACVLDVVTCQAARGASDRSWILTMRSLDTKLAQLQEAEKRQLPRMDVVARSISCIAVALPLWGHTTWIPTYSMPLSPLLTPPGSPRVHPDTTRRQDRKKKQRARKKRKAKAGASNRGVNADVTSIRLHSAQTESSAAKQISRKTPLQLSLLPNTPQSRSRARALLLQRQQKRPSGKKEAKRPSPLNWSMTRKD